MVIRFRCLALAAACLVGLGCAGDDGAPDPADLSELVQAPAPVQVYGSWHCGNDFCTWGTVRDMANFDAMNHWLIDRGNGSPSVNLVVLSFVNPLRLLNHTTDTATLNGVPRGMTAAIVNYFASHGVRVMLSIGGITYVDDWNTALDSDGAQLGRNAAALATQLGVGIEIDYEENTNPRLTALQDFINAYRAARTLSQHGLGAAIDFNVPENQPGSSTRPFGSMDPRIVAIFEAFHFRFGGCFNPRDPMHFEYCETPCAPASANAGTLGRVITPRMLLPLRATDRVLA